MSGQVNSLYEEFGNYTFEFLPYLSGVDELPFGLLMEHVILEALVGTTILCLSLG